MRKKSDIEAELSSLSLSFSFVVTRPFIVSLSESRRRCGGICPSSSVLGVQPSSLSPFVLSCGGETRNEQEKPICLRFRRKEKEKEEREGEKKNKNRSQDRAERQSWAKAQALIPFGFGVQTGRNT
jgi:hypothetical protein